MKDVKGKKTKAVTHAEVPPAPRADVAEVAEPAEAPQSTTMSVDRIRALRERYPVLSAAFVRFFEGRQPAEKSLKTGGRTTAVDVYGAMVDLTVRYERARSSAAVARFISAEQMRWLCDHAVLLGDAIARRDHAGVTTVTLSTLAQSAWDAARPIRNELAGAMGEYVKERPEDEAALSEARGTPAKAESTERSLRSLAALASKWLASNDELSQIAASEAALTRELVERALAAADALKAALNADREHEGSRNTKQDTPEINTLEGRVLLSLKTVRSKHNRARESDPTIPAVAVPEVLAAVLGATSKTAAKATTTPVQGDPAAPATTEAAPAKKKSKKKNR